MNCEIHEAFHDQLTSQKKYVGERERERERGRERACLLMFVDVLRNNLPVYNYAEDLPGTKMFTTRERGESFLGTWGQTTIDGSEIPNNHLGWCQNL